MKHTFSILLCVCMLFSLCACSRDTTGCMIYYPVYDTMQSCDPQIASSDTEKIIVTNCFEGLVRVNEDGEIVPAAAESWNVSPDGLIYTFHLRKDAQWMLTDYTKESLKEKLPADFAPKVTADDFVFALQRALNPATGADDAYLLYSIANARTVASGQTDVSALGVRAVNEYTLEIELSEPQSNFLYVLTECICMPCNRTFFEACGGRYGMMVRYYMSNGPFYLYMFSDTDYSLYASEVYNGAHKPKPSRVFLYYNEDGKGVEEKMSSEFYSAAYLTDTMFAQTKVKKSTTVTELENTTYALLFNLKNESLQNENVRRGIVYATDARALAEMTGKTYADSLVPAVCGFTPPVKNMYNESIALETLIKGFVELSQPRTVEVPVEPSDSELTDVSAAATTQMLEEPEEVERISLTLLTVEKYADALKRQMQSWQRILGLRCVIRIETVSDAQLRARVAAGEYEIAFAPLTVDSPDALGFLLHFSADSPSNCISLQNQGYTALLDAARAAGSTAQQEQYITAAADYLQESGCIIPVFSTGAYLVQTTGVSGVYCYTGPDRVYFDNAFSEN